MKIVVGLGNPGIEYVGTRHNVGFDVIDRLAERFGWVKKDLFDKNARSKFDALVMDGNVRLSNIGDEKFLLIKPMTYMNVSGKSVQAAATFYQVAPKDVMIILDDVAFPCGAIRMRSAGSSGGHNGLKDIERVFGTNVYPRLRVGIDAPPQFVPQKDYVLGKFGAEQREKLKPALDRACGAIQLWAERGIEVAMSQFNSQV